ncbi:hypothetical protein [Endozoicomonas arenosclerae]|nr:hypothetical protein [Endozoicomonas arenosclerae]
MCSLCLSPAEFINPSELAVFDKNAKATGSESISMVKVGRRLPLKAV